MEKQHESDIINKAPGLTKVSLAQCACPPNTCHYSVSVDHLGPVSESGLSPPVTGICTYCQLLHGGKEEGRGDENEGEREEGRRKERKEVLHQGLNFKADLMVQVCNPSYWGSRKMASSRFSWLQSEPDNVLDNLRRPCLKSES